MSKTQDDKKNIIVIGGGIVGLMCAYNLYKNGIKDITIIDKNDLTDGTSFGNAGLLSAFSKNPLSSPGVILNTLKLILKGESPVNIHPSIDFKLYIWLWDFVKNSNQTRLKKSLILFERYGQISLDIYKQMVDEDKMDFHFCQDGLLMVYTQQESFDKKIAHCNDTSKYEILSCEETKKYLPLTNDKIIGSVLLKQNGHLDPTLLMNELKTYLINSGIEIITNEEVQKLELKDSRVSKIHTTNHSYEANTFILSTGANDTLAKQAKNSLLMTPAKGYSITFDMNEHLKPKTCALFADLFIAMTPRKTTVRITSKLELGSNNKEVVKKQIESIKHNLSLYTQPFEMINSIEWTGFRPLTPNDMPLIGYDENYNNLIHATGLGWLGMTFSPAIGKIISELIIKDKKNKNNLDVLLFSGFYQG